jgi:hypothetical protein
MSGPIFGHFPSSTNSIDWAQLSRLLPEDRCRVLSPKHCFKYKKTGLRIMTKKSILYQFQDVWPHNIFVTFKCGHRKCLLENPWTISLCFGPVGSERGNPQAYYMALSLRYVNMTVSRENRFEIQYFLFT